VKGNQPTLHEGIVTFFDEHLEDDFARVKVRRHETQEKGHGRVETRHYFICPLPEDLPDHSRWSGLKAIGIVITSTQRGGKDCGDVRYYILSKYLAAKRFAEAVRGHWGIENRLHWQLDVTFQEDQCRLRQGHADANFSILRRAALGLLKNERTAKLGIKNKRLSAGWNETYLEKVLLGT
jgi:predicted transposase YbfD/YdcC